MSLVEKKGQLKVVVLLLMLNDIVHLNYTVVQGLSRDKAIHNLGVNQTVFRERACGSERGMGGRVWPNPPGFRGHDKVHLGAFRENLKACIS